VRSVIQQAFSGGHDCTLAVDDDHERRTFHVLDPAHRVQIFHFHIRSHIENMRLR
jgi:hypothetical protein